jgi:hypothetical protein
VRFDAVVVCAGLASATLLRPLGLRIPMAPVYGHSVSAPIREPLNAPRSAVMDERYKVAISRLGQRVRVAGSAEIGGSLDTMNPAAIQTLYKVLHDWFPGAATLQSGVQQWKGARPMLPDGPPVLGASGIPGVWLNLGHGSSGWALVVRQRARAGRPDRRTGPGRRPRRPGRRTAQSLGSQRRSISGLAGASAGSSGSGGGAQSAGHPRQQRRRTTSTKNTRHSRSAPSPASAAQA